MNIKKSSNYKWIDTEDGSQTLYSELYDENCHSHSGARSETQFHYIEGCEIEETYQKLDCFILLEVGLGTGMGIQMTIDTLNKYPAKPYTLISTEIDPSLVEFLIDSSSYPFFKALTKKENHYYSNDEHQREIIILVGDARKTVPDFFKSFTKKVNAIYQDAFSPRRNPDLWTTEWFTDLKNISDEKVKLSTYSASSSMRKSMIAAGWKVYNGPKFGHKRASTRAGLIGESAPEVLERLARSPIDAITDASIKEFKQGNPKL